MSRRLVQAAGAVLWRPASDDDPSGDVLIALVHRPRYDDWSLPKGKLDPGESFADAALREIHEETGFTGTLGADLGEVRYTDHKGRPKVVRWWAMAAGRGTFVAGAEVDELRWVPPDTARALLDYHTDLAVLDRFVGALRDGLIATSGARYR